MSTLHVWGNINTEGKGKTKDFSVPVLIVCWVVAVAYGELAEGHQVLSGLAADRWDVCWSEQDVHSCPSLAGDESPTCWQWWQRGLGTSQHCCCCWSAQWGPSAALCTLPVYSRTLQPWLCPKSWTLTGPCAFPGQEASDISMEHPARVPLPAFAAQGIPVDCLTAPTSVSLATTLL